jgi:hypothetical protein
MAPRALESRIVDQFESILPRFSEDMSELRGPLLLLRAHLYVEQAINFVISEQFKNPEALLGGRGTSYSDKIRLLSALGVKDDFLAPYKKLGALRNKMAHDIDYVFDDGQIKVFLDCFVGVQKDALNESLKRNSAADGAELSCPDKFVLAIVSLWAAAHALPRHLS